MADHNEHPIRTSLLPPDPREGRRRFGPILLLIVGLGSVGVVYAYRDRLRPAPAAAPDATPTLADAASFFAPMVALSPAATSQIAAVAARVAPPQPSAMPSVDPFAEVPPAETTPAASVARPEPAVPRYRLQSIVLGRRGGSCLINGRPYQVGDTIDDATVRSIDRDRVVLRVRQADVELRLPLPSLATGRISAAR